MMQAIELYRRSFRASDQLDRPYVMLGFNVIAADTEEEARYLSTSRQQAFSKRTRQVFETDAGTAWNPSNRPG